MRRSPPEYGPAHELATVPIPAPISTRLPSDVCACAASGKHASIAHAIASRLPSISLSLSIGRLRPIMRRPTANRLMSTDQRQPPRADEVAPLVYNELRR